MVLLWTLLFRSSDALLCTFFCWLVVFSCPVISESVQPRGHTRLPCPSPSPRACSNSWPLNQCCHPTISSSAVLFSSYLQSFPTSGSFRNSQFFASGGQSIGGSFSFSISPSNEYSGLISFRIDRFDLFLAKRLSGVSNTTVQKHY